jgi:glycosyltransferase involved in cell wall biosynthesis
MSTSPTLSVIVPVYNEKPNIVPLLAALKLALASISHEIILVDDGSADGTVEEILAHSDKHITLLVFSRNFGQTSALAAGIDYASGQYIATLDGDLQNDPDDIPMMLNILTEGNYDIVAGNRANRKDGMLLRKIPSKIANILIRKFTNVHISDYGCTLKVFRAELAKKLDLYGELHRFIPILGSIHGAKITEVAVKHHPRIYGTSKYGIGRTMKVVSDLMLMFFFQKYSQKPMHLFGTIGVGMFMAGGLIETYMLGIKLLGENIGTRPLFTIGFMLIITSVQLITAGFLAELIMRTYYGSQRKKPYSIASCYTDGRLADNCP